MRTKIYDFELIIYDIIDKHLDKGKTYVYRKFTSLVDIFNSKFKTYLPVFVFMERYKYLTELSRVIKKPRNKITIDDILKSKLNYITDDKGMLALGVSGFPFINKTYKGNWRRGRDKKFVCSNNKDDIIFILVDNFDYIIFGGNFVIDESDPLIQPIPNIKTIKGKKFDLDFVLKNKSYSLKDLTDAISEHIFNKFKKHVIEIGLQKLIYSKHNFLFNVTDIVVSGSRRIVKYDFYQNPNNIKPLDFSRSGVFHNVTEKIRYVLTLIYLTISDVSHLSATYFLIVKEPNNS